MNDARPAHPNDAGFACSAARSRALAILAASAAAIVVINHTEPTAQQINATRKSAALVETVTVQRGTYRPASGRARNRRTGAGHRAESSRQRAGDRAVAQNSFPVGWSAKATLLLRIDPADFENALSIREE